MVCEWWSENRTEKSLFMVQNVWFSNGQLSYVTLTLPFEYQIPILSGIQMNPVFRSLLLFVTQMVQIWSIIITSLQGSTLPLTNFITHPLCFLTAFCCDATSQLFSWKGGGALDVKNPDPYYYD